MLGGAVIGHGTLELETVHIEHTVQVHLETLMYCLIEENEK